MQPFHNKAAYLCPFFCCLIHGGFSNKAHQPPYAYLPELSLSSLIPKLKIPIPDASALNALLLRFLSFCHSLIYDTPPYQHQTKQFSPQGCNVLPNHIFLLKGMHENRVVLSKKTVFLLPEAHFVHIQYALHKPEIKHHQKYTDTDPCLKFHIEYWPVI